MDVDEEKRKRVLVQVAAVAWHGMAIASHFLAHTKLQRLKVQFRDPALVAAPHHFKPHINRG